MAKRRRLNELRTVPMSSVSQDVRVGDDTGPSVDPDRFQGAEEPCPGHWRQFPAPWTVLPRSPEQHALGSELQARLEAERHVVDHLVLCDGGGTYLEQLRATALALGALPPDRLLTAARQALLAAFRTR